MCIKSFTFLKCCKYFIFIISTLLLITQAQINAKPNTSKLQELFDERVKSVVIVEYFIQRELDRQSYEAAGIVINDEGVIILLDSSIPRWVPSDRIKGIKVFIPGKDSDGYNGEYLGYEYLNGWHYIKVNKDALSEIVSVKKFPSSKVYLGQEVWGIGVMPKSFVYNAYLLQGGVATIQQLPLNVVFSNTAVSVPGGPVFDNDGNFLGWAGNSLTDERVLIMRQEQMQVGLRDPRESSAFLLAEDFFNDIAIPIKKSKNTTRPWIGIAGLQPIDREVASFLGLENQGAVVLSKVLDDSPATIAGIKNKDIILSVNGIKLPKLKPDVVVQRFFERQILLKKPGDKIVLNIARGENRKDFELLIARHPKSLSEASRFYFEKLGITVREFILSDAINRRLQFNTSFGVIASFVKPNSQINTAGLQNGDWIKEIDGVEIQYYEDAIILLNEIEESKDRNDFIMLIDRNNETSVIRVKLNK